MYSTLLSRTLSAIPIFARHIPSPLRLLRPSATFSGRHRPQTRNLGSSVDQHPPSDVLPLEFPPEEEQKNTLRKLSKTELGRYLYPLLCYGWTLNTGSDKTLSLTRKLVFKGPVSARKFLTQLLEIEEKLWHHTSLIHLNGDKRPTLTVMTQTHDLPHPWISLRDILLAAQLEHSYRNGAFGPVKGEFAVQPPSPLAAESWATLLKTYPWDTDEACIIDNIYKDDH